MMRLRTGPFGWVSEHARLRVLASLTALVVGASLWLGYMDGALVTPEAPNGIVSFELAGSSARAHEIIQSWSHQAQSTAMLIQGFDYLYLLLYPAWLSLAALSLGARLGGSWGRFGLATSWIVLGAAPLDAVESYALVHQVFHGASEMHAQLAWYCAVPKFALVSLGVAFLVLAGGAWVLRLRSG